MAWSTETTATQLTSITSTEQFFDVAPVSTPGESYVVEVDVNFVVTPTDDMIVALYGTLAATPDWDDTPIQEWVVDKDTDPNKISFVVSGLYKWRVGCRAGGATDTQTSADLGYREDNVDLGA